MMAYLKAQRSKQANREVIKFRSQLHENLANLRSDLLAGRVVIGNYFSFKVYDPKERTICAAPFVQRVLHHALMNVCEPVFESYQIYDSYACRKNKGVYAALARAQTFACRCRFYLKLDIRKYFDSVDHDVLKQLLERRIKDVRVLDLFAKIIDSYTTQPGKGIPIGNLTSQFFANHYLGVLDHWIKEQQGCACYVRYMDDFVLWHDNRSQLKIWREQIDDFLCQRLRLELKPPCLNWSSTGMSFLGYRVFPQRMLLTQRSRTRFRRKLVQLDRRLQKGEYDEATAAMYALPLLAFAEHADTKSLRKQILNELEGFVRCLEPCVARRQLEQQRQELPFGEPQQEQPV